MAGSISIRQKARGKPKMGRPRAFREEEALDAAMRVFWEKGYEGASLDDLTQAMGINRSSLYSSFGDKEALFRRVITRYGEGPLTFLWEALRQPTARAVIEALLLGTLKFLSDPSHPPGCLTLQAGLACSADAERVKKTVIDWRCGGLAQIQKRMQQAKKDGDLLPHVDPKDLARYVAILMNGLGVQAVNGATPAEMSRVVQMALRSMPL
jgi:AcrR family transcriptional regulator